MSAFRSAPLNLSAPFYWVYRIDRVHYLAKSTVCGQLTTTPTHGSSQNAASNLELDLQQPHMGMMDRGWNAFGNIVYVWSSVLSIATILQA